METGSPDRSEGRTYRGKVLHGVTDVQHGGRVGVCTRRGAGALWNEAWVWVARAQGAEWRPVGGVGPGERLRS